MRQAGENLKHFCACLIQSGLQMSVPAWLVLRQEAQGDLEAGNGSVQSLQLPRVNSLE